jgi:large subunit ribosomal protein L21
MYAVIEAGGHQWKVELGTQLDINRVATEVGSPHTLERVLLAHDGAALQIGRPYVEGAKVVCEVIAHRLGVKTISYHFRRRENWRKTVGHRQPLTRLLVKDIFLNGKQASAAAAPAAAPKARAPKTATPHAAKPKAAAPRAAQKPSVKKEKGHGA